MVAKHNHAERHWGVLPLPQTPPLAGIAQNPAYSPANSIGGVTLEDVADPVNATDAANKEYVDGLRAGLLTGDSSTFATGIGDWEATDGSITITDETSDAWAFTGQHHAKIVASGTSGQGGKCPLAASFLVGVRYAALFVVKGAGADNTQIEFGTSGDFSYLQIAATDDYMAHVLYWTPQATTALAELRALAQFGTAGYEIDIAWAAIVRADALEDTALSLARIPDTEPDITPGITGSQSPALIQRGEKFGHAQGVQLVFTGQDLLKIQGRRHNAEVWVNDDATGSVLVIAGAGGSGGDLSFEGAEMDVGPDGLSLFVGEKDSATLQLYPGASDAELSDNPGTGEWIIDCGGAP